MFEYFTKRLALNIFVLTKIFINAPDDVSCVQSKKSLIAILHDGSSENSVRWCVGCDDVCQHLAAVVCRST